MYRIATVFELASVCPPPQGLSGAPYYPVNDERNNSLAAQYRQLAEKEADVIFGGRLAQYKYYDMAPVIESVMELSSALLHE